MTIIRKIIKPTTRLPWMTKFPNVFITCPASPLLLKISLVEAILSESRKSVIMSNSDGNIEKSSGSLVYIDVRSITIDSEIFITKNKSKKKEFKGMIISNTIPIITPVMTTPPNRISILLPSF